MRLELLIDGMRAVHAKYAIFTALGAVEGVTGAEVELGRVVLEFASEPADLGALEAQLHDLVGVAGYDLREVRRLPRTLPLL